jgi:hypothetical protein
MSNKKTWYGKILDSKPLKGVGINLEVDETLIILGTLFLIGKALGYL